MIPLLLACTLSVEEPLAEAAPAPSAEEPQSELELSDPFPGMSPLRELTPGEAAEDGTAAMNALEDHLRALSPDDLSTAQAAARDLVTNCPFNRTTVKVMHHMVDTLSDTEDATVRRGVAAMSRVLTLLDLHDLPPPREDDNLYGTPFADNGALTTDEIASINPFVRELTGSQRVRIDIARDALYDRLGEHWPPRDSISGWYEVVRLMEPEVAAMLDVYFESSC